MEVVRGVDRWLERLGLNDRRRDRLDSLSHGNQQRVQLVAALVNEPELLVLDEPFSGLDPLAVDEMSELLVEIAAGGAAVVFSSHQLDLVEHLCEDVVIIDRGRVASAGTLEELRSGVPVRHVQIRHRGGWTDWSQLPGVEVLDEGPDRCRLRVGPEVALATLVETAGRSVEIVSFVYEPPTLSDLFRQAVGR